MKKIAIVLLTLTLLGLQTQAQDNNGYIGITIGPSIPVGDFTSTDLANTDAGLANTGFFYDITLAYKLGGSNFGISSLLRSQANPVDVQSVAEEFSNRFPGTSWRVESKPWTVGAVLIGGFGSIPISQKVTFDTKAMIGFSSSASPDITFDVTGPGGSGWIKQSSVIASSFAFLVGGGFKFEMGNKLFLLTNVDYFNTRPEFRNIETTTDLGDRVRNTSSLTIQTLNISIGVAVKI
jgi:hypothetical protein